MKVYADTLYRLLDLARRKGTLEVTPLGAKGAVDASYDCESPVEVFLEARNHVWTNPKRFVGVSAWNFAELYELLPRTEMRMVAASEAPRLSVTMLVRCRKCIACVNQNASHWARRAVDECGFSAASGNRTWFLTLLFAPDVRRKMEQRLREMKGSAPVPSEAYMAAMAPLAKAALQRYFKRLRRSGRQFRYVAAIEPHRLCGDCKQAGIAAPCAHASWFPHLHVLLHETNGPIRKRELKEQWVDGWSKAVLVGPSGSDMRRGVWYVIKYMKKWKQGRVPASIHYGSGKGRASRS